MFWETQNTKRIEELELEIIVHNKHIEDLLSKMSLLYGVKPESLSAEEKGRLADLEVKMAKLWALLIEYTPNNKEKLSKFGKRFGGKARQN